MVHRHIGAKVGTGPQAKEPAEDGTPERFLESLTKECDFVIVAGLGQ